jgi:hypothetical protein
VANTTDPDSALMKAPQGFIQGYNAQAVASGDQLVVAAAVTRSANDLHQLEPMLAAARATLACAGITSSIGVALADAGYWSEANSAIDLGIDLLIATTKSHKQPRRSPPPEPEPPTLEQRAAARLPVVADAAAGALSRREAAERLGLSQSHTNNLIAAYQCTGEAALKLAHQPNGTRARRPPPSSACRARQAMEAKLADESNRALYSQRGWLIEGVFAHSKELRGFRRFLRRGLIACDSEWKLNHLAGNLLKLHRHRQLAPPGPRSRPTTASQCRLRAHRRPRGGLRCRAFHFGRPPVTHQCRRCRSG